MEGEVEGKRRRAILHEEFKRAKECLEERLQKEQREREMLKDLEKKWLVLEHLEEMEQLEEMQRHSRVLQGESIELAEWTTRPEASFSPLDMQLRNGKTTGPNAQQTPLRQMPLVTKGRNQIPQYTPWSFCDMIGLAGRLPDLNEGANKWITALEESTAGVTLALGDIKALLMHMAGTAATEEVFKGAHMPAVLLGNSHDPLGFNGYRSRIWAQLRKQYPEKMDPSKLEGERLRDEECPAKFLRSFQNKWREETGGAWNENSTTESLFKVMAKKAMPQEVQKRLDNVVGLMKMDWPLFSEHLVHHVENVRKEKQKEAEVNKSLASKLTQLQLNDLHSKQKKEKTKIQAPVVAVEQPLAPQSATPQTPKQPQAQPEVTPVTPPASLPPIHVHVNQPQVNQGPPYRGQPRSRGGNYRPGRGRGQNTQMNRQTQSQNQSNPNQDEEMLCWGCDQKGHCRRDCPTNPWVGPAKDWQ